MPSLLVNLKQRKLGKEALSMFIYAISGTINRIIALTKKSVGDFLGEDMISYLKLKMCKNTGQLKKSITEMFDILVGNIIIQTENADSSIAENMILYIHENYIKDISLMDVAEHFNLSHCYISTLFKKYTGSNFKDYLNTFRVQTAKKIMDDNPNIKIKELTEKLGYNSVNSFIRIFNRYEGISPGKYEGN